MFLVFFLLSFMFVSCFILVCTLYFVVKLLVIDGTPKNWSSTYGQEHLALNAPNVSMFGVVRENFS
jgi:hypothetical protein